MSKREKLARVHAKIRGSIRMWEDEAPADKAMYLREVDVILDELMEPGEEAKLVGARSIGQTIDFPNHTERSKDCWQAMLTRIKDGNP